MPIPIERGRARRSPSRSRSFSGVRSRRDAQAGHEGRFASARGSGSIARRSPPRITTWKSSASPSRGRPRPSFSPNSRQRHGQRNIGRLLPSPTPLSRCSRGGLAVASVAAGASYCPAPAVHLEPGARCLAHPARGLSPGLHRALVKSGGKLYDYGDRAAEPAPPRAQRALRERHSLRPRRGRRTAGSTGDSPSRR
jgi:hypothetical protein